MVPTHIKLATDRSMQNVTVYLKAYQRAKGLSIREFASQLQVHYGTLYRWTTGVGSPNLREFVQICRIMKISADELLGFH